MQTPTVRAAVRAQQLVAFRHGSRAPTLPPQAAPARQGALAVTKPEDVTNGDFNKKADAKARIAADSLFHPENSGEPAWSGLLMLFLILGMCGGMALAAHYLNHS